MSSGCGQRPAVLHNGPVIPLSELAGRVDAAAENLRGVALRTPLQPSARLSAQTGARVLLKREDLQPVRSYKLRGAYHLMSQLSQQERDAGVVCASAGNHAQGLAWACARLNIEGEVFVPTTTPRQKRERILALGAGHVKLTVIGETYDAAVEIAAESALGTGRTVVPAFDDPRIIAGQGTVAREIVEQLGTPADVVLIPVGGGGLMAGCAAWLRTNCPQTHIVGVEPTGAAAMIEALASGHPVRLDRIDSFVDGAAVRRVGDHTFGVVQEADPQLMAVPEGQVCSEMLRLYQIDGIIAEPAGALATAALGRGVTDTKLHVAAGDTVVAILSGGNNDVSRYSEIIERSLVHEGRKHYLMVNFSQEPGALRRFLDDVLGPDDDIVLFEYTKRSNREIGPALVGIELGDPRSFPELMDRLSRSPLQIEVIPPDSPFYRYLV